MWDATATVASSEDGPARHSGHRGSNSAADREDAVQWVARSCHSFFRAAKLGRTFLLTSLEICMLTYFHSMTRPPVLNPWIPQQYLGKHLAPRLCMWAAVAWPLGCSWDVWALCLGSGYMWQTECPEMRGCQHLPSCQQLAAS